MLQSSAISPAVVSHSWQTRPAACSFLVPLARPVCSLDVGAQRHIQSLAGNNASSLVAAARLPTKLKLKRLIMSNTRHRVYYVRPFAFVAAFEDLEPKSISK